MCLPFTLRTRPPTVQLRTPLYPISDQNLGSPLLLCFVFIIYEPFFELIMHLYLSLSDRYCFTRLYSLNKGCRTLFCNLGFICNIFVVFICVDTCRSSVLILSDVEYSVIWIFHNLFIFSPIDEYCWHFFPYRDLLNGLITQAEVS